MQTRTMKRKGLTFEVRRKKRPEGWLLVVFTRHTASQWHLDKADGGWNVAPARVFYPDGERFSARTLREAEHTLIDTLARKILRHDR